MMDREYLQNNLSAYLDGELDETTRVEYERELARHPDLQQEVVRLRKLNDLARQADIELPPDGYFDSLAERIDAQVAKMPPPRRTVVQKLLRPSSRVVGVVGSIAAVLLIAVVGLEIYRPAIEQYEQPVDTLLEATPEVRDRRPVAQPDAEVIEEQLRSSEEFGDARHALRPSVQSLKSDDVPKAAAEEVSGIAWELESPDRVEIVVPDEQAPVTPAPVLEEPALDYMAAQQVAGAGEGATETVRVSLSPPAIQKPAEERADVEPARMIGDSAFALRGVRDKGAYRSVSLASREELSEDHLDSLINLHDSAGNEAGAARLAYRRAQDYSSVDNIRNALDRVRAYLKTAPGRDKVEFESYAEDLQKWLQTETEGGSP
jgi:negative regulator of sigma E activity